MIPIPVPWFQIASSAVTISVRFVQVQHTFSPCSNSQQKQQLTVYLVTSYRARKKTNFSFLFVFSHCAFMIAQALGFSFGIGFYFFLLRTWIRARSGEHNHGHTPCQNLSWETPQNQKVTPGRNMIDLRTRNVADARTLWLGDAPKRQGHLAGVSVCTCM